MAEEIIRKSKIGWVIRDNSVIAFDRLQATIYHSWGALTKLPLISMKDEIRKSTPDELNSWVDVIELAQRKGLIGNGCQFRNWES